MSTEIPPPPSTGDAELDEALRQVAELCEADLDEQVAALGEAEKKLQALLDSRAS